MSLLETSAPGEDGVVTITLNRPEKKNALSTALRDEISDALDALESEERVRCVVVTGAGDTFCAGFDLAEFSVDDADFQRRLWASSDRYHQRVIRFPLPIVAAVNGPAIAGGFDLAVMCDLRVASTTALFAHPERAFGEVVYAPLHDLVGGAAARDLCLTGRRVAADEALAIGLVNRVVVPDALMGEALAIAADIATVPRALLQRTKAKIIDRMRVSSEAGTLSL